MERPLQQPISSSAAASALLLPHLLLFQRHHHFPTQTAAWRTAPETGQALHSPPSTPVYCSPPPSPPASHPDPDSTSARNPPRPATRVVTGDHAELRAEINRRAALADHHSQHSRLYSSSPQNPATDTPAHLTMAHRTASIDSTVSSVASATSVQPRLNGISASLRASPENPGPQDASTLINAAGSADVALVKLLAEKQQVASHNAQLWRLVEKQRAMILGLNKDLEKALKEKERYRKKLKDQLAQTSSAPSLLNTTGRVRSVDSENASPASSQIEPPSDISRDISVDRRKVSDSSDAVQVGARRSDTPQDAATLASALPANPPSIDSLKSGARPLESVLPGAPVAGRQPPTIEIPTRAPISSPISPRTVNIILTPSTAEAWTNGNHKGLSASSMSATSPQTLSSPKTRKAPPTPLKLDASKSDPSITNNIIDASDSEYEEDPESARSEFVDRGRRKTREDDDREREALVRQEEEQRSRSKKSKKSKSRPSAEKGELVSAAVPHAASPEAAPKKIPRDRDHRQQPIYDTAVNPAEMIRNRALSDATGMLPRNHIAPSLLSPGLPMSPRPVDRPPNSPMPRPPNTGGVSIPMSPKFGLPLSPRAPRQPIPLPPQTPLAVSSPHLDRAKAYHQQAQFQQPVANIADFLKPTPDDNFNPDRPPSSNENTARSPGEVFTGLISDDYPGLLLPPNALPSIFVKTASSRMKPSRASFIAPKGADENPVFTLAVHQRSDRQQLWRLEKTYAAFALLDSQVKALCTVRERLPEKALFAGHAPSKVDARRMAINSYFETMMDSVINEKAAVIVCKFLSTDTHGADGNEYFDIMKEARPDSPTTKLRPNMAGYLTKRGKNFGGWKARYFVLDGPSLKYFENRGGAQLGSIKLQNAQIGKQSANLNPNPFDDEENQYRHAFLVLEPKKKDSQSLVRHVLCAENDGERDAWVDALLKYVDFKDDEEILPGQQAQVSKTGYNTLKHPRAQKSMTDLRPSSHHSKDSAHSKAIGAVGYSETVAGEAPMMGPPASPRFAQTPSPPFEKPVLEQSGAPHPAISGPLNLHVIQNTGDWGMKPPSTPGGKDKKRSMFSNLPFTRGRSSSDLAPPENGKSAVPMRGIFGVPLAEAVAAARPDDITTELPAVVYRCIEYLTARNATAEEGIFRLSGSSTVIKSLKDRFNTEGDVNLLTDENYYDVHAVASLLKLYLRELPASILTRDLHLDFLHCLEMNGDEKVFALNMLVNKLPVSNRALLQALSAFMVMVVDNVGANRMNVRNLGVVFSPTLNLPGPLISLFVEEQQSIFGPPLDAADSPISAHEPQHLTAQPPGDLRSPRKQMFSELPTPAYNQTQFQTTGGYHSDNTGMIPLQPSYASYQMAPQGEGGFGSLNDALRAPTVYGTTGTGEPTPRDVKTRRRESAMLSTNNTLAGPQKKPSMTQLREEEGASF